MKLKFCILCSSLLFLTLPILSHAHDYSKEFNRHFTLGVLAGIGMSANGSDFSTTSGAGIINKKLTYGVHIDMTYRFMQYISAGIEVSYAHVPDPSDAENKYVGLLFMFNLHMLDDWFKLGFGLGGNFGLGPDTGTYLTYMINAGLEIPIYKNLYFPIMVRTDFLIPRSGVTTLFKTVINLGFRYRFL